MDTPRLDESGRIVLDDDGEQVRLTPWLVRKLLSDPVLREHLRRLATPRDPSGAVDNGRR